MKTIYIVLTYTGTALARIVKFYTKKEYSHISLALDKELNTLCSFGRLNPYNPFIGGFVREGIDKGTFKRFKNTTTKILSKQVTDEQYKKLEQLINKVESNSDIYRFNIAGLFAVAINKKIYRKNYFYCAEFIKYLLEKSGIEKELPYIPKPEDFLKLENTNFVYEGKLRNYNEINTKE